jgi:hypothetical protein
MVPLKNLIHAALVLALAALILVGCEDGGVIPPTDSTLTVYANPANVVIDELAGETEGTSTIVARVFDASGFPAQGVDIFFTTSGGTLSSNPPGGDPTAVKTDSNGNAFDTLLLTLADPTSVDVGAVAGSLTEVVTVTKTIASGNQQPQAIITAQPTNPNAQRVGQPVTFSGINSSDPDGEITCYKWTITSSVPANNEVVQGPSRTSVTNAYAEEQLLTVKLQVSDSIDAGSFCVDCQGTPGNCGAPDSNFSPFDDVLDPQYEIVCDLTSPLVFAGPDQNVTLTGGTVNVILDGSASNDPESGVTDYSWNCGNGTASIPGAVATCVYSATGQFNAELTVTNGCGMNATDDVTVTVN